MPSTGKVTHTTTRHKHLGPPPRNKIAHKNCRGPMQTRPAQRAGQTRMRKTLLALVMTALALTPAAPIAQTAQPEIGPETGLPLPRYVSLKTSGGRARRGPSTSHRVDWVFEHRNQPLRITGEFEHWRRVEDFEGEGGWVHYSQLSGVRTVMVRHDMAPMLSRPQLSAPEVALLETGVVAHIMECVPDWCRLSIDGTRGWVDRAALWGLHPDEVLD